MCRRIAWLVLTLIGFACSSVAAQWKDAVDAGWHPPQRASIYDPFSSPEPKELLGTLFGDLDLDPAFGNGGVQTYYLDYPSEAIGMGLRVYAMGGGAGWYALAKHKRQSGYWDAAVIKVRPNGSQDTVYLIQTPLQEITDAVMDASTGKFYFVGNAHNPALPGLDRDFGVTCVDIQSAPQGGPCAGFGSGGTAFVGFNLGGGGNDYATRVVVRPNIGLILSGVAEWTDHHNLVVTATLYRASGALVPGFGTNGRVVVWMYSEEQHVQFNVFDTALSNGPDAQTRLYIAGNFWVDDPKDEDGYVIALNAMTGVPDASFDGEGIKYVFLDLGNCSVNCSDAVTAIRVLANGKLAVAGWTTDTNLNQQLMLGRLNIDGSLDPGFDGAGLAWLDTLSTTSGLMIPRAISERPDTRDLVVAMDRRVDGNPATPTSQALGQWSASGRLTRTTRTIDFDAGSGQVGYSVTAGLLVDADAAMLIGSRRWNATDYDVTLVRTLTNDTLFADQFGGPASD